MELVVLTFFVSIFSSFLSGLSGGGGALILTPYYIFIGLSPQQAVATGKFAGLGVMSGSLTAFSGKGLVKKQLLLPLMSITVVSSLLAAWLIPKLDSGIFQTVIGVIIIAIIPVLFLKKESLQPGPRSGKWISFGFILYALNSFAQGMFGTGLGMLLTINLMLLFGLSALAANATKRMAQSIQTSLLFVLLLWQGLIVVSYGLATLFGSAIGSYFGSHTAIKKGNKFVKVALAITMVISGLILILTA